MTSPCKGPVHLNLFRQTVVEKSDWMSCGQNGSVLPQMTFLKQMSETSQTKEFEGRKIEKNRWYGKKFRRIRMKMAPK